MALQDTIEQLNNLDINGLDFSRVGVWPLAGRVFIWLVAIIAIMAATYFVFVKELHQQLDLEVNQEASLKQTFQEKAFQAATLEQYLDLMVKMERDFKFLV